MAVREFKRPTRKTDPFKLFAEYENGRIRSLKYDVNALADFEQETGMGFAQMMGQRAVFGAARAMLWAGLKHEDRTLTIEDVGTLLSDYLSDEEYPPGVHTIDGILMECVKASVNQGALARRDQKAMDEFRGVTPDPNAVTSPETTSGSSQTDTGGPNGSSEPKNTPTENSPSQ